MQLANKTTIKSHDSETRLAIILWVTGMGVELLAMLLLISENHVFESLFLHILASLILAGSLQQLMPKSYQTKKLIIIHYMFCLFTPVVSGLGLLLSLVIGVYHPKSKEKKFFENVTPPIISDDVMKQGISSHLSSGHIRGILLFCPEQEKRIQAILATRHMEDEIAIPLLNIGLLDSLDEVRLLAYSMLDSKRKKLDLIIHKGLTKLKSSNLETQTKALIHQNLAETFWELCYLELVEGQSLKYALKSAKQHVKETLLTHNKDTGMHLLHARICISQGLYDEAQDALNLARINNMPALKLAPFYAEIAFEKKRFGEISKQLKHIDDTAQQNVILGGLVAQWG